MKKIFISLLLLPFITTSQAKVYTPEQLNQMVNSGNYPEQSPAKSDSSKMEFDTCLLTAKSIMSQIADNYPVSVIVDTSLVYSVKAWTNDGTVMVTCSQPDKKMVITQSQYK